MRALARVEEAVSRVYQIPGSAWYRARHRSAFDHITTFCLFVGYPRSGHSLIGALLNAHRNAVIAHELNAQELILAGCSRDALYAQILARAAWFNLRGNKGTYPYQVPGQWQGRFDGLRVIGDKRGGAVSRCIAAHPDFLNRARTLVGCPLRLIHVVRNPFDNISAISIDNLLSLADSVEFYFRHCRTTGTLASRCDPVELITIRHETMIRDPGSILCDLLAFLGLQPYPGYLEACAGRVFGAPTYTRRRLGWTPALVRDVERRAREFPFLGGYGFAITPEPPARDRRAP